MTIESDQSKRTKLRKLLIDHFDLQDLQDLCFDLGVDFDNLGGGNRKAEKIRELILYMEKRFFLSELVAVVAEARPNVTWPEFQSYTTPVVLDFSDSKSQLSDFSGIPTGFTDVDKRLGGLHKGELILVASRPSMGKSSLITTIALVATKKHRKRVVFFSLQMSNEQLVKRIIALEARITLSRLFQNELADYEWPIYSEVLKHLQESPLTIIDNAFLTPSQLRAECQRLSNEDGVDLIVIDGLELICPERTYHDLEQETNELARLLKNLARELNVPILITSQLGHSSEQRQDKRPLLRDAPGNLDQFADVIMFLYRDDYYYPDTTERPNIAELNIVKNRNGPTWHVDLYWHSQLAAFRNLIRQEINL